MVNRALVPAEGSRTRRLSLLAGFLCSCLPLLATPSISLAEFEEVRQIATPKLHLANLIGEVRVEPATGSQFEVTVHVQGEDGTRENISLEEDKGVNRTVLVVKYPVDKERKYVYPRMGAHSSTTFDAGWDEDDHDDLFSWLTDREWGRSVSIKGSGRGLEVWSDVVIKVPAGKELRVKVGVGDISARNVNGELTLSTNNGEISARDLVGRVGAETGSGDIGLYRLKGDLGASTGSGDVSVGDIASEMLTIETGSGDVEADSISCLEFRASTGSGRIQTRRIQADEATLETGSGRISADFDKVGDGRFELSTGSGSIRLRLPADTSAHVEASTGSGSIDVDVSDPVIEVDERDEVAFQIGDGGARISLETGSGSIEISD